MLNAKADKFIRVHKESTGKEHFRASVKENWHFKLEKVSLIPSSPSNDDCKYQSGKPNGRIQIRYLGQKSNHPSNNKEEGGGKNHMRWLFTEVLSVMAKKMETI